MDETQVNLLADGIAAARAGDNDEAQRLLRRATEAQPDNVAAWIWRASVAPNRADKIAFLEEALALDPTNEEARLALARVAALEGERAARVEDEEDVLFCTVHPDRETMLRCNRCGRPMCTECAVRHPVGLRCRECVAETRSPIYQVDQATALRALLASVVVSTVVGALVLTLGRLIFVLGIFFALIIGFVVFGAVGRAVAEAVQRIVPRKRGRTVQMAVAAGMVVGLLIAGVGLSLVLTGTLLAFLLANWLLVLLYLGVALPAAVASLN